MSVFLWWFMHHVSFMDWNMLKTKLEVFHPFDAASCYIFFVMIFLSGPISLLIVSQAFPNLNQVSMSRNLKQTNKFKMRLVCHSTYICSQFLLFLVSFSHFPLNWKFILLQSNWSTFLLFHLSVLLVLYFATLHPWFLSLHG